nr:unnamed protein product [Digitaria exilis]
MSSGEASCISVEVMSSSNGGGELRQQRRGRAPGARHRGCAAVPCFAAPESLPLTQEPTQIETKSKLTRVPSSLHKPPYMQATIPWPTPTIAALSCRRDEARPGLELFEEVAGEAIEVWAVAIWFRPEISVPTKRGIRNLVKQNLFLFYFDAALLGLLGADLVQRIEQCPIAPSSIIEDRRLHRDSRWEGQAGFHGSRAPPSPAAARASARALSRRQRSRVPAPASALPARELQRAARLFLALRATRLFLPPPAFLSKLQATAAASSAEEARPSFQPPGGIRGMATASPLPSPFPYPDLCSGRRRCCNLSWSFLIPHLSSRCKPSSNWYSPRWWMVVNGVSWCRGNKRKLKMLRAVQANADLATSLAASGSHIAPPSHGTTADQDPELLDEQKAANGKPMIQGQQDEMAKRDHWNDQRHPRCRIIPLLRRLPPNIQHHSGVRRHHCLVIARHRLMRPSRTGLHSTVCRRAAIFFPSLIPFTLLHHRRIVPALHHHIHNTLLLLRRRHRLGGGFHFHRLGGSAVLARPILRPSLADGTASDTRRETERIKRQQQEGEWKQKQTNIDGAYQTWVEAAAVGGGEVDEIASRRGRDEEKEGDGGMVRSGQVRSVRQLSESLRGGVAQAGCLRRF